MESGKEGTVVDGEIVDDQPTELETIQTGVSSMVAHANALVINNMDEAEAAAAFIKNTINKRKKHITDYHAPMIKKSRESTAEIVDGRDGMLAECTTAFTIADKKVKTFQDEEAIREAARMKQLAEDEQKRKNVILGQLQTRMAKIAGANASFAKQVETVEALMDGDDVSDEELAVYQSQLDTLRAKQANEATKAQGVADKAEEVASEVTPVVTQTAAAETKVKVSGMATGTVTDVTPPVGQVGIRMLTELLRTKAINANNIDKILTFKKSGLKTLEDAGHKLARFGVKVDRNRSNRY